MRIITVLLLALSINVGTAQSRSFRLGFTLWPADLTAQGVQMATDFADKHGDLISVMFIGGLPWPEASTGQPFSADVQKALSYRPPPGHKLFVSVSPLNEARDGMAPYWGEHDNMPLPPDWSNLPLNDPKVEAAYLNICRRFIDAMHPDYLAIGVELNVLLSKDPVKWAQLKTLYHQTYRALKKTNPTLPIFFTTDIGHYTGGAQESKGKDQKGEVADLMKDSDLFAMSFYPYGNLVFEEATKPGYLDFAKTFHKPIAVSESGMLTRDVTLPTYKTTLHGTPAQQEAFESFLLSQASKANYSFVINFATTDFERLTARLTGPAAELASVWAYTGLQDSAATPKPALKIWDRYLSRMLP